MSVRRRRDCLLSVLLVAVVLAPASGQTPARSPTGSTVQGAAAIPDFSGMWVHPYFPGFEPPVLGPGPVLSKLRRPDGGSNTRQLVGDYTNPILKPEAAEKVKNKGNTELAGGTFPTPSNQCWPSGLPYIFFQVGMQMPQQPHEITVLYLRDHEVRHVRLNEPHPARVTPSWYGNSVGHYEGDTLVIDTVGVRTDRPFAMADMFGTPYSPALHVVERYRLIDYDEAKAAIARGLKENVKIPEIDFDPDYRGKHLQLQFTVEDKGVFTMPWSATITYARPFREWEEHACAENILGYYFTGNSAAVPTANKPDF
jgi:hypothetical protein